MKEYVKPAMYAEAFAAEQYVAASNCTTRVGVPAHGGFYNSRGEYHCVFTASTCGDHVHAGDTVNVWTGGTTVTQVTATSHKTITLEDGSVLERPDDGNYYFNCHVFSTNEAAQSFASTYTDSACRAGVLFWLEQAAEEGNDFVTIETAFS